MVHTILHYDWAAPSTVADHSDRSFGLCSTDGSWRMRALRLSLQPFDLGLMGTEWTRGKLRSGAVRGREISLVVHALENWRGGKSGSSGRQQEPGAPQCGMAGGLLAEGRRARSLPPRLRHQTVFVTGTIMPFHSTAPLLSLSLTFKRALTSPSCSRSCSLCDCSIVS